jgi:hypothetical protein
MLAKAPKDRYQTPAELLDDLEALPEREHRPVKDFGRIGTGPRPSGVRKFHRFRR